jgi:hypothetical protein
VLNFFDHALKISLQNPQYQVLSSSGIGETSFTFGLTLSGRSILDDSAFPAIVTVPASSHIVGSNADMLARTMQ